LAISPVGRRAARDFWWARADETCGTALERLRADVAAAATPAPVHFCYVVDGAGVLVGCAALVAVIGAAPETRLRECMNPRVIPIPEGAPEEAIQDFFITYGFLSFPVVDRVGKLVGVVRVDHFSDLVFEGFETQVREETYRTLGLHARELEDRSVAGAAGLRLPWLAITLGGGIVAALALAQAGLAAGSLLAVAVFLPLGVMLAERITLRTLALRAAWPPGEPAAHALRRREMGAAVLLAVGLAPVTAGLVFLWQGAGRLALAMGAAVFAITVVGAGIGLAFPTGDRAGGRGIRALVPLALALVDLVAVAIMVALVRLLVAVGSG
jgi:magnesium transporter